MTTNKITPEELWARQQISPLDVDYDLWNERRATAAITNRLTPEIKQTILQIKFDVPDGVQIPRHRNLPCCFRGWGSQLRRTGTMERNQSADK